MCLKKLKSIIEKDEIKNNLSVVSMVIFLIKNKGTGSSEQIAKLMKILEYKESIDFYKQEIETTSSQILKELDIIQEDNNVYTLTCKPKDGDFEELIKISSKSLNGFFKNL
jgi:hypothetical protein